MVKALVFVGLALASVAGAGRTRQEPQTTLQQFLERVQGPEPAVKTAEGSLWPLSGGRLTDLATDYKAHAVNDLVVIRIVESTLAQASGSTAAQRTYAASSGISSVAGQSFSSLDPLLSLHSGSDLKGTGTANSQSQLRTSVAGRVVAVLPNGNLAVEVERQVAFNQQSQTLILRGLVRPGDIASDDSVLSTSISDLEIELKGKGVVSDATRQPNLFMRLLWKVLGF